MSRLIDADRLIVTMAEEMYSEKTFDEIMEEQPTVKAIPLEKLEQIRAEIENLKHMGEFNGGIIEQNLAYDNVLEIIDKALKEQNE